MHNDINEKFSLKVRAIRLDDLAGIKKIFETWMVDPDTKRVDLEEVGRYAKKVEESIKGGKERRKFDSCYLVAEIESGKVVGIIGYRKAHPKMLKFAITRKPAELNLLFVAKKYQGGKGVGTALVKAMEEVVKKKGYKEVLVRSAEKYRKTGWGFYNQLAGYKRVGVIEEDPGKPQIWRKEL